MTSHRTHRSLPSQAELASGSELLASNRLANSVPYSPYPMYASVRYSPAHRFLPQMRTMRQMPSQAGQTVIALLIFMMVAITLTLTATMIVVANIRADSAYQNGELALSDAQTGVENALLRLERDNSYAGETMTLTTGTVTITVSGTSPKTIVSVGSVGNLVRTITATATVGSGVVSLTGWSETP